MELNWEIEIELGKLIDVVPEREFEGSIIQESKLQEGRKIGEGDRKGREEVGKGTG